MVSDPVPDGLVYRVKALEETCRTLEVLRPSRSTPWYRNPPTLISLFAVLFSLGTTVVSCNHTRQQDIQAARVDLRALLQRLAALPKENIALRVTAERDPDAAQQLSSLVNQEASILVSQAAETIARIPEYASSVECFTVGHSFGLTGEPRDGFPLLQMAIDKARVSNDEIGARRVYGYNLMAIGDLAGGRRQFDQALTVFLRFPPASAEAAESTHAQTEMWWAQAEASVGEPAEAVRHLGQAYTHAAKLRPGPQTSLLLAQLNQVKSRLDTSPRPPTP